MRPDETRRKSDERSTHEELTGQQEDELSLPMRLACRDAGNCWRGPEQGQEDAEDTAQAQPTAPEVCSLILPAAFSHDNQEVQRGIQAVVEELVSPRQPVREVWPALRVVDLEVRREGARESGWVESRGTLKERGRDAER
jgi:hypothetical protein